MDAKHGPPQSSSALALMHLTCGHYRKILRIPYTRHVTNVEVRATIGCHPLSHLVTDRRLRLFGHTASSSPQEDHHRAVTAVIRGLPPDWKRPSGRLSHTWLRAVEADLGQQNIGLASAWRKAAIRDDWWRIVDTAEYAIKEEEKDALPVAQPTVSNHLSEKVSHSMDLLNQSQLGLPTTFHH